MSFLDRLLDLLYPPKCTFCHKLLPAGEREICQECRVSLPRTAAADVRKTGFLKAFAAPLFYEKTVRESLHRYKFGGVTCYAPVYAALMAEVVRGRLTPPQLISWVPLSRKRLRKRGYDQARLLAEELSASLAIPCVPLLEKQREAPPQSGMGGKPARQANISGCYLVPEPAAAAEKRILLVDDIVTTGSTLSECARMLRMAGASEVQAVTVACARDPR